MIDKKIIDYFHDEENSILTPYKNICMVFHDNNLVHAMMILKQSTYQQIPVLDYKNRFVGLISVGHIYKSIPDGFSTNFEDLRQYKVSDFLDTRYAVAHLDTELEEILKLLLNFNFVNIVDDDGVFQGMITRSSFLKKTSSLLHNIHDVI